MTINTSAEVGPGRWASIGPEDFAEVQPSGSTRPVSRTGADCDQGSLPTTTALSPGHEYRIVIAFQLDDSAQRAMLRPDGAAGWVFDLPPLTQSTAKPSPSAPASTTRPLPTTIAPAPSTAPSTATQEATADTSEA